MKKRTILCLLIYCVVLRVAALSAAPLDTVSFDRLSQLQQKQKRLTLVLIGTEWCKYCEAMERYITADWPQAIEQGYYFLKLDVEEKEPINFNKHLFYYRPTGASTGLHELATYLGTDQSGSLSFPTICILSEENELLFRYQGFLRKEELGRILMQLLSD
ncbi:thioredoxin family protein [Olivibacter sp. XZL3]|uniref:thioredoxin family protein n=1 Tax=Olivibacter sp. XZL3 TaxID=1735116 RepID=UPI001066AFD2|nr:thioredoxin family protein [Olivibacter sp. XZL3]